MGTYRFLLAIMVALSHMGVSVGGLNPGVFAVISFFLISGFVMTGLVRTHYAHWHAVPLFYLDRMARIFPQYLLFLLLTAVALGWLGLQSPYLAKFSAWALMANVAVVPLDFFMFSDAIARFMLIPQAWSLGLELLFYLLVPWLLLWRLRGVASLASLLIWGVAAFGVINTDTWGYRLLPGTLFMFLAGSYVYDQPRASLRHPAVCLCVVLLAISALLIVTDKHTLPYNREVVSGLVAGIAVLFWLARLPRYAWDDWLGNLSYGVFLCHFLVMWLFEIISGPPTSATWSKGALVVMLCCSVLLAWLGFKLVEKPVLRWRYQFRQRELKQQPHG